MSIHLRCLVGLLGVGIVASCTSGPASIAPEGLAPIELSVVQEWLAPFTTTEYREYQIRPWRYRTQVGAASGRAAVVIAPPDSLRFDYQGPFRRSGRAAVVGDSALWVVPEEDFRPLVTLSPLFWAALGLPKTPPSDAPLFGLSRSDLRAWRYIIDGDTVNFVLRGIPTTQLRGEIRRAGRAIGVVTAEIDSATSHVISARLDLPIDESRFEFTIVEISVLPGVPAACWEDTISDECFENR